MELYGIYSSVTCSFLPIIFLEFIYNSFSLLCIRIYHHLFIYLLLDVGDVSILFLVQMVLNFSVHVCRGLPSSGDAVSVYLQLHWTRPSCFSKGYMHLNSPPVMYSVVFVFLSLLTLDVTPFNFSNQMVYHCGFNMYFPGD